MSHISASQCLCASMHRTPMQRLRNAARDWHHRSKPAPHHCNVGAEQYADVPIHHGLSQVHRWAPGAQIVAGKM